ncbi:MAG: prolipoprotein diacylglyceryl transferase [Planctomyces sp.]|jgi:phosphatidylglycerol:prolipoprotein diacylglycerol transferase
MRTNLLRFMFDSAWRFDAAGNELYVGAGWLILVWTLAVCVLSAQLWRREGSVVEALLAAGFWLVVPAGFLGLLLLQPDIGIVRDGFPVFGYGFMMFVGFSTASWLAARRIRSIGVDPDIIWDMLMWALIPGLIGARAYFLLRHGNPAFSAATGLQKVIAAVALWDGGIVFYGSVIGGMAGIATFCRLRKLPLVPILDVLTPSLLVGEGFGRIGCFLYGCCYGRACSLPWAVQFPPDSLTFGQLVVKGQLDPLAQATIPLHPVQLYSSAAAFVLAGILAWYFRRRPYDGAVMSLAAILYPISRYGLESLRADVAPFSLGLKDAEIFSLLLVAVGIGGMYYFSRHRRLTGSRKAEGMPTG